MPAILTSEISAISAAQFIDSLSNTTSNIYLGVGRDAELPWTDDTNPPTPTDTPTDEASFRSNLIGIKRVKLGNAMLMVPRVDWQSGVRFEPLSTTAVAHRAATNYYCRSTKNYVYRCISAPADNALTTSVSEPDLIRDPDSTSTDSSYDQTTDDGYVWRFMYDILPDVVNNGMLLDDWMPVPYNKHATYPGGSLTENQYYYGDKHVHWTMGAYRVLITVTLANEGTAIPYSTEYRQVGLFYDPRNSSGTLLQGDSYTTADFDTSSGRLFYLENRVPIQRMENQSERIQLLLTF